MFWKKNFSPLFLCGMTPSYTIGVFAYGTTLGSRDWGGAVVRDGAELGFLAVCALPFSGDREVVILDAAHMIWLRATYPADYEFGAETQLVGGALGAKRRNVSRGF